MKLFLMGCLLVATLGCSGAPAPFTPTPAAIQATRAAAISTTDTDADNPRLVATSHPPRFEISRVLIVSVDGLRPDLALRGDMPRLRSLCQRGSYTFWAETTPEAYTLPCHVTMLTGVSAQKHGVTWNNYIEDSYPTVPTLFELAKQAHRSTAVVAGKMKFIVLTKPDTIDHCYLPDDEPVSDEEVAKHAVRILRQHRPEVMFVHLPGVDTVGHEYGWGSPRQMAVIAEVDRAIGMLLDALIKSNLSDTTLLIVTADHGGAAKSHQPNDPTSHFIPWIVAGPGIQQNLDLTTQEQGRVRIEDTFATTCDFLSIDPGPDCEGRSLASLLVAPASKSSP